VRVGTGCVGVCTRVRVPLLMQLATLVRHIVTSFVAALASSHFSTSSDKRHEFRRNVDLEIDHYPHIGFYMSVFSCLLYTKSLPKAVENFRIPPTSYLTFHVDVILKYVSVFPRPTALRHLRTDK
jgi:hypothetical protein